LPLLIVISSSLGSMPAVKGFLLPPAGIEIRP
jgi:hypothetical protein